MGSRPFCAFRGQYRTILKPWAALGCSDTLGKLAEAIGLDDIYHLETWRPLRL